MSDLGNGESAPDLDLAVRGWTHLVAPARRSAAAKGGDKFFLIILLTIFTSIFIEPNQPIKA